MFMFPLCVLLQTVRKHYVESHFLPFNKVFFIYFSTFYLLYSRFPLASTCCYSLLAIARTTPYIEYVSIRVWLSSSRTSARAAPVEKDSQFRKIHFLSAFLSIETKKSGSRPSPSVRQTAEFSNFKYAPNWRITRPLVLRPTDYAYTVWTMKHLLTSKAMQLALDNGCIVCRRTSTGHMLGS